MRRAERIQSGERIFHLLKRHQRRLAIVGHVFVVDSAGTFQAGMIAAAGDQRFQSGESNRPDRAGSVKLVWQMSVLSNPPEPLNEMLG